MRISHKNKFIFFSFPKTGSESLRQMLDIHSDVFDVSFKNKTKENPFYSHISPHEMREIFNQNGWDYDSYYKIICVRNPYERLASLYEMIYRKWPIKPPFSWWINSIDNKKNGGGGKNHERWRKYGAYSLEHFIKSDDKIIVDEIIKLEDFDKKIPQLFKKLNLIIDDSFLVLKKNIGKRKRSTQSYYNKKTSNLVKRRYSWEINKFNYKLKDEN
jgi:hypothetical protein